MWIKFSEANHFYFSQRNEVNTEINCYFLLEEKKEQWHLYTQSLKTQPRLFTSFSDAVDYVANRIARSSH